MDTDESQNSSFEGPSMPPLFPELNDIMEVPSRTDDVSNCSDIVNIFSTDEQVMAYLSQCNKDETIIISNEVLPETCENIGFTVEFQDNDVKQCLYDIIDSLEKSCAETVSVVEENRNREDRESESV